MGNSRSNFSAWCTLALTFADRRQHERAVYAVTDVNRCIKKNREREREKQWEADRTKLLLRRSRVQRRSSERKNGAKSRVARAASSRNGISWTRVARARLVAGNNDYFRDSSTRSIARLPHRAARQYVRRYKFRRDSAVNNETSIRAPARERAPGASARDNNIATVMLIARITVTRSIKGLT